jgi:hypothetical protein
VTNLTDELEAEDVCGASIVQTTSALEEFG